LSAVVRLGTAAGPLDATVEVPGSKSIANRALICAALGDGESELTGMPPGDDTRAMVECLDGLGVQVDVGGGRALVSGTAGSFTAGAVNVHAGLAGTTSRFVTAVAALAPGPVTVDGDGPLRRRPMGPLHDALLTLGADVRALDGAGHLPVSIAGPLRRGGTVELPGDVSSQFLTALMLIGPLLEGGLEIALSGRLVSVPYIELTADVMAAFGVDEVVVRRGGAGDGRVVVPAGRYRGITYVIEPDASSASYPLAMAAVAGGRVLVPGLTPASAQSDVMFAGLLGVMGCRLEGTGDAIGVARDPGSPLSGIDVDLRDNSDLVPTVAVVAATASTPTRIRGVGFIRAKESDRLGDLAAELTRTGAAVTVEDDGLTISPAPLHGAHLDPHHDHRLAMAYGVLGTLVEGIEVADPRVVTKSWPDFWSVRDEIVRSAG
jgi:3-phosphoshikimate 1-carboxyvinyltransferase